MVRCRVYVSKYRRLIASHQPTAEGRRRQVISGDDADPGKTEPATRCRFLPMSLGARCQWHRFRMAGQVQEEVRLKGRATGSGGGGPSKHEAVDGLRVGW